MTRYPYAEWKYQDEYGTATAPGTDGYAVLLTIPYRAGMRKDFADLRFRHPDRRGCAYYVESKTDGVTASVWVRLYAGQKRVQALYGNGRAVSESNGAACFDFFDGFDGTTLDASKWDSAGTIAVSGGAVSISGTSGHLSSKSTFGTNVALVAIAQYPQSNYHSIGLETSYDGVPMAKFQYGYPAGSAWNARTYVSGANDTNLGNSYTGVRRFTLARNGSTSVIFSVGAAVVATHTTQIPSTALKITLGQATGINAGTLVVEAVFVRKYQAVEPVLIRQRSGPNPDGFAMAGKRVAALTGSPQPEPPAIPDLARTSRYPYAEWKYQADYGIANPPATDGYQAMLVIPYRAGMRRDFADLRFRHPDLRRCRYWIEGITPGVSAVVWVRLSAGQKRVQVLYGNSRAVSGSDPSIWDLFDDFAGATLDPVKWTTEINGGSVSVSGGVCTVTSTNTNVDRLVSRQTFGTGVRVLARIKPKHFQNILYTEQIALRNAATYHGQYACYSDAADANANGKYQNYNGSFSWLSIAGVTADTWVVQEIARRSSEARFSADHANVVTNATNYAETDGALYVSTVKAGARVDVDWIAVGKYAANEPAFSQQRCGPNPWGLAVRRASILPTGPGPIVVELGRALTLEAGTALEGAITAETGRSLTPYAIGLARGPDMVAELGRSLTPEAGTALETTLTAEMERGLTLAATAPLETTLTAEMARGLELYADAYEAATEIIAEMGRSLTLAATAPLETAITAEMARALGLAATAPLTTTATAELGRSLSLEATAPITLTLTAEMERSLSPTPPRATYWYNFDGVKWISSTVRRSITDHFWQLDEEISGAEELPIDFLRQAKVIAQDLHGTSRCIFYGMLPGINQKIAWRADSTTIRGHDHGWRLSDQKVPAARRVISPTVDPRDVVLEFLGGDSWETKTEVRPYRIAPLTAYGTEAMPAHQWEFSPETSCMEAIREFDEKCDRIFLVKWMQIGNAISVDNPDPSRRLMRVEAEDFDPGGEGVGYHDVDTRNLGGAYRPGEGVDIENTPGEGGRNVGWIRDGEWLDFTREFAWAGTYAFSARVAAATKATPAYFKVYLDGVYQFKINVGAAPTSDNGYRTGSYQTFTNTAPDRLTSTSGVVLADAVQYLEIPTTGDHTIRLEFWGNTENITPSVMHQNIARFDLTPQGGIEIDTEDVRYQSVAYWVDEDKIDSATEGLDLPPPLTISDPGRWPKDESIQITKQARQRYNRVIVRGHSASGVWFEATAQTPAVAAGEPPSEYLETNDRVTVATIQGYANALLAYYQLDQRSYQCTLMQRMELEIYQKICFTDHPQLPSAWCRITSVEKRVDGKADSCTITFVPEQTLAAQRRLQRMLRPTNTSAMRDVVRSELARQSEVWVGTCAEIIDDDTATFTLEQGGTSQGRITPDG